MEVSKLKLIRKHLRLTQEEFAEKLHITQSYYSALERGDKKVGPNVLDELFNNIGVSPAWYFSNDDQMKDQVLISDKEKDDYARNPIFISHNKNDNKGQTPTLKQVNERLKDLEDKLEILMYGPNFKEQMRESDAYMSNQEMREWLDLNLINVRLKEAEFRLRLLEREKKEDLPKK
jgi:transcriptional regulator with XRE-family HTH domain